MKHFQDKLKFRKRLYSKATIVFLVVIILLFLKGVGNIILKERESSKLQKGAQIRLAELEERKEFLSKEIDNLKDEDGIERELRNRFAVAKEGEKVILVVNEEEVPSIIKTDVGIFESFILWLKNIF